MNYIIHTDGGSRGNPGEAAIGVVIDQEERGTRTRVVAFGKRIGVTTNNVAEYTAVIEALRWVIEREKNNSNINAGGETLLFYLDSLLVVNQLNGLFKVKDSTMRTLMFEVRKLENSVAKTIRYSHVPREQNSDADFEVNKALDAS